MTKAKIASTPDSQLELGRRESGKLEKRRRIKAAARRMFIEKGYEASTTREIATQAGVGIGTIFVYAKDKRDLLLMIVNDDLDELSTQGVSGIDREAPLLDQLVAFFQKRYQYWASEPGISRPAVQETFDFLSVSSEKGEEAIRFYSRRSRTLKMLSELVHAKQLSGEISADDSADLIASLLMTIYLSEVRRWLSAESLNVRAGIASLRKILSLALRGVYIGADSPPPGTTKIRSKRAATASGATRSRPRAARLRSSTS